MDNRVFWVTTPEWERLEYVDGPYTLSELSTDYSDLVGVADAMVVGDSIYYGIHSVMCTTAPKEST